MFKSYRSQWKSKPLRDTFCGLWRARIPVTTRPQKTKPVISPQGDLQDCHYVWTHQLPVQHTGHAIAILHHFAIWIGSECFWCWWQIWKQGHIAAEMHGSWSLWCDSHQSVSWSWSAGCRSLPSTMRPPRPGREDSHLRRYPSAKMTAWARRLPDAWLNQTCSMCWVRIVAHVTLQSLQAELFPDSLPWA